MVNAVTKKVSARVVGIVLVVVLGIFSLNVYAGDVSNTKTTDYGWNGFGATIYSKGRAYMDSYVSKKEDVQTGYTKIFGGSYYTYRWSSVERTGRRAKWGDLDAGLNLGGWWNPFTGYWYFSADASFSRSYGWNYDIFNYGFNVWVGPIPVYVWVKAKISAGYTVTLSIYGQTGSNGASVIGISGSHSFGGSVSGEVGGGVGIPVAYFGIAAELKFVEGNFVVSGTICSAYSQIYCYFDLYAVRFLLKLVGELGWGWFKVRYEHTLVDWRLWGWRVPVLNVTVNW